VVTVNFSRTVYLTRAFVPFIAVRPEASLVNVSSRGRAFPFPDGFAFGTSKAAVKLFTEGLIAELRGCTVAAAVGKVLG